MEIYFLLIYIYLNKITSLIMFKIVISLIYNTIVKNISKKKSRIISLLKKTIKKIEEKKLVLVI